MDDLVRITHDKRTVLNCKIAKEPNGVPVYKEMYFKVSSEDFMARIEKPSTNKSDTPTVKKGRRSRTRR